MMSSIDGPETIKPRWDFPKGGIKDSDRDLEHAILRELKEETGSDEFEVVKQFSEKIFFEFPEKIQDKLGFRSQEVTMFSVNFLGTENSLKSQDEEVDEIKFFSKEEVNRLISFEDSKEFFNRNI